MYFYVNPRTKGNKFYPPYEFHKNLFDSFCVVLLTNQPINQQTELLKHILNIQLHKKRSLEEI